jgi:hypothetical protein
MEMRIRVPDDFHVPAFAHRAILAGLSASQGFCEPSEADRRDLVELDRRLTYVTEGLDRVFRGEAIPVLDSKSGEILIEPIEHFMTDSEREEYLARLMVLSMAFGTQPRVTEEWLLGKFDNEGPTELQKAQIRFAATLGNTRPVPHADVEAIVNTYSTQLKQAVRLNSVAGGSSFIRRGADGKLNFEPVSSLSAGDQKKYFELRTRLGLHGRFTPEVIATITK